MIDSIINLYEIDGRLFATSRDADGERLHACIMLAETDCDFDDGTETGEDEA